VSAETVAAVAEREGGGPDPADGRSIAPSLGLLAGEGSGQRVKNVEEAYPSAPSLWRETPTRSFSGGEPTYYGRPLLKGPVWVWAVPAYFYIGGTAGAAAVLGAAAQAVGGREMRSLVTTCRWVAAVGGAAGSALLTYDLGRPGRFLHMLRVFRPTSPMSIGSWVLAGTAACTMGSALLAGQEGFLGGLGDAAGYSAALFGLPLAGYTAVLVGNTAVPVWQAARRSLPPLFMASAMSGAASLFGLLSLPPRAQTIVHRFGTVGKVADLAAMAAVERDAGRIEPVGKPLREGLAGTLWKAARVLTGASLAVSLLPGRARWKRIAQGVLGTAGALSLRFAVLHAGRASARDPQAAFRSQRSMSFCSPSEQLVT
jgi:formate-dependent nitrite reductase membrane component NrfD